nr:nonaspanin [Tanacetum cinerariifolium]
NSTEYLSVLGAAISKAVEKDMQEGLSAGITHGAKGRKLADVAAYNPFAKFDYLSALQRLQNVNFSLITELKSNKDASVDTIMNLLRLDDTLTERLSLTESQPHADQLMVPIHHSPDQRVVGASALSISLDVSHSLLRRIRENIANHVSALRGVFVPLSEPLFAATLEGTKGTSGSAYNATTALSVTFVFASTISPISTDDYKVAHADGQESASVGGEAVADENIDPFPDVKEYQEKDKIGSKPDKNRKRGEAGKSLSSYSR